MRKSTFALWIKKQMVSYGMIKQSTGTPGLLSLTAKNSVDNKSAGMTKVKVLTSLEENFEKKIRPLLDAVDRLRTLKVTDEGVTLPTIVVVGDQSSGKSSVLESLATIILPRGQGIATRVPLILRLQSCKANKSSISITANEQTKIITEDEILSSVEEAQDLLAGTGKGISDTPISLHIKKPGAPDLSMIDLPGITRVPVRGQPDDIYEQISAMIRFYIKPPETVILNVISGQVDFSTCESIRMSQQEDKEGQRTLAVVTKVDMSPDGIYEKVMANDVNVGLGFVCVRNRTDADASHEAARERERLLFSTHPNLSKLDKCTVGIGSLAEKLPQIQAQIIRKKLPTIITKIETAISERQREWEVLTQGMDGKDPITTFLKVVDISKTSMESIMRDGKYDSYSEDKTMHYPPRLDEMFRNYSSKIIQRVDDMLTTEKTKELLDRMSAMKGLTLSNFLCPTLMRSLVEEEVAHIALPTTDLVAETHEYAREFAHQIIDGATKAFPTLRLAYKQMLDKSLSSSHEECSAFVKRILEKERGDVFTINDSYSTNLKALEEKARTIKPGDPNYIHPHYLEGLGTKVNMNELKTLAEENSRAAFMMKASLAAYWMIMCKRMADVVPMEIKFSLARSLLVDSRNTLMAAHMGGDHDLAALMEQDTAILQRKQNLLHRLKVLKQCRQTVESL